VPAGVRAGTVNPRRRLEVGDIIRGHAQEYLETRGVPAPLCHRKVLRALAACRTAVLGGHAARCDGCGHVEVSYNSCRDRHCPKCQASARAKWLEARCQELLPVEYFHVVFTLPHELAPLVRQNRRALFGLLFRTAATTLLELAADARHLGARIGVLAVLHTWGQNLHLHPHVHCVVTGGGLSADGAQWVSCRPRFFLPVKVLSRLFRGKFLAGLRELHARRELVLAGPLAPLAAAAALRPWLAPLYGKEWVVYAKPPFGGPQQVLKYLARYTHRVAISNDRLLSLKDGRVTFSWKNYARSNARQTMTLAAAEFLRRFLEHVTPSGFVRIRYYGLWSNRGRDARLALCRQRLATAGVSPTATRALNNQPVNSQVSQESLVRPADRAVPGEPPRCPACGLHSLQAIALWPPPTVCGLLAMPLERILQAAPIPRDTS